MDLIYYGRGTFYISPRRRYRAMTDDEESSSDDGEAVLGDDSRDEADSSAAGDE